LGLLKQRAREQRVAFQFNEYGYAAAMASVLVVVLMAITVLMFVLTQGGRFAHE
jgi:multiple sugar transport system permease protein